MISSVTQEQWQKMHDAGQEWYARNASVEGSFNLTKNIVEKYIMSITVDDVKFLDVRTVVDSNGNLIPIESNQDIPFEIKRVFYVYGVRDEERRGKHAHYNTQQVLICLYGKSRSYS